MSVTTVSTPVAPRSGTAAARGLGAHPVVRGLAIAAALLGLSVYATWPLATHMGRFVYEDDPFINAWSLWWVAHSLVHLDNPWWTAHILSPDGSYLSFHALFPLLGVLASPLTLTLGAALTYNVLKLILGPITAVCGYALARTLGLPRAASWIAGCLWGFSIISEWRIAYHMNFGGALWVLPLTMLFAVRFDRAGRTRDAVLIGAGVGACLLLAPTMALLLSMALALWVIVAVWRRRDHRATWVRGGLIAAGCALLVGSPQLIMMQHAAHNGGYKPNLDVLASTWVGTDTNVHTMLSPGNVRSWFPGGLEHEAYKYPWGEATPAYGWCALLLGAAGFVLVLLSSRRRILPGLERRAVVWGVLVLLVGSIFALGPELTFRATPHVPLPITEHGQRLSLLMPYTWLVQLPLFQDVRVPSRFVMLGMLGLSMLAGFGAMELWRRGVLGRSIAVVAVAFGLVEIGFPDGGAAHQWVPLERASLYAPIRADHSDSTVVDIPLAFVGATAGAGRTPGKIEPMLRGAQHGHPIAEGYVTRLSPVVLAKLVAHPFYAAVLAQQGSSPDDSAPLPVGDPAALRADVAALHVGWVVLWPSASARVPVFLQTLGFTPVRRRDGIIVYRAPPAPSS